MKSTGVKIFVGILTLLVVGGTIGGVWAYRFATPWLSAKDRMEELRDSSYTFEANVVTEGATFFPECEISGEKQDLRIHGDVKSNDEVLTDIYAGIGEVTYVNTKQLTTRFMGSLKESLSTIPLVGPMIYSAIESKVDTSDRYMTLEQVQQLMEVVDFDSITGGNEATSFDLKTKTYHGKNETAWGTYDVTPIDTIEGIPASYDVESDYFRVVFSNGNTVDIAVPKDTSVKRDYLVVRTASIKVSVDLTYTVKEDMKPMTYPEASGYSDEDMATLREIFETLKELKEQ